MSYVSFFRDYKDRLLCFQLDDMFNFEDQPGEGKEMETTAFGVSVCVCVCVCIHACVLWFESLIIIVTVISPLVLSQHGCLNLVSVKHTRLVCAYRFVLSKRFIIVMTSKASSGQTAFSHFRFLAQE